jgi:hypothetical protein
MLKDKFFDFKDKYLEEKRNQQFYGFDQTFLNDEEIELLKKYYNDPDYVVKKEDEEKLKELRITLSNSLKTVRRESWKDNLPKRLLDSIAVVKNTYDKIFGEDDYSPKDPCLEPLEDKWQFDDSLEVAVELEYCIDIENPTGVPKLEDISGYITYSLIEDNIGDETYLVKEAVYKNPIEHVTPHFNPWITPGFAKHIRDKCIENNRYAIIPKELVEEGDSGFYLKELGFKDIDEEIEYDIKEFNPNLNEDEIEQGFYVFNPAEIDEEDLLLEED